MPEDKWNVFLFAKVSQPIPGEHAFGTNNNIVTVWLYGPEEGFGVGFYVSVQDNLTSVIEDAQIHFVGVQVDTTVEIVLFGVKSHEKASFVEVVLAYPSIIAEPVCWVRGGLLYYQLH